MNSILERFGCPNAKEAWELENRTLDGDIVCVPTNSLIQSEIVHLYRYRYREYRAEVAYNLFLSSVHPNTVKLLLNMTPLHLRDNGIFAKNSCSNGQWVSACAAATVGNSMVTTDASKNVCSHGTIQSIADLLC